MARQISNARKLIRILEQSQTKPDPNDPFIFSIDDSIRVRQLIAEGLVTFFAKLHGIAHPGQQALPDLPGLSIPRSKPQRRKR